MIYFQCLHTVVASLPKPPLSVFIGFEGHQVLEDCLIDVGDVVDGRALQFVVETVLAVRTLSRLEFVRKIVVLVPHEGVVLKIRVVFPEGAYQFCKFHEVERGVLEGLKLIGQLTFGDEV